jgi:hypothetical protein
VLLARNGDEGIEPFASDDEDEDDDSAGH